MTYAKLCIIQIQTTLKIQTTNSNLLKRAENVALWTCELGWLPLLLMLLLDNTVVHVNIFSPLQQRIVHWHMNLAR